MDENKRMVIMKSVERCMDNLKKNNMLPFFAERKEQAVQKVEELLCEGDTVAVGGSMTLFETGIIDLLRSGKYNFLDRYNDGLTRNRIEDIYMSSLTSDVYLSSTNSLTEQGDLYNVDGNSNRVAALLYGPKSVIIVAGYNKIVPTLDDAVERVKRIAAPANASRLNCNTYCSINGRCVSIEKGDNSITAGCGSEGRICCNYVISAKQRIKDRIKVIIVGEEIGY